MLIRERTSPSNSYGQLTTMPFDILSLICLATDALSLYYLSFLDKKSHVIFHDDRFWKEKLLAYFPKELAKATLTEKNCYTMFSEQISKLHAHLSKEEKSCFILVKFGHVEPIIKAKIKSI